MRPSSFPLILCIFTLCVLLPGCYNHRSPSEAEAMRQRGGGQQEQALGHVNMALNAGKAIVLTRIPGYSRWETLGDNSTELVLRPENPFSGGFSVAVAEPGTYFLYAAVASSQPDHSRPVVAQQAGAAQPSTGNSAGRASLGTVHVSDYVHHTPPQVLTRYHDAWGDLAFNPRLGLGFGRSSRHGWGSFAGIGASYSPFASDRTVCETVHIPGSSRTWLSMQSLTLPESATPAGKNQRPLVASLTLGPGEVVVTDSLVIAAITPNEDSCTRMQNPAGNERICDAASVTMHLIPVESLPPQALHNIIPGRTATVRPLTRGLWLVTPSFMQNNREVFQVMAR